MWNYRNVDTGFEIDSLGFRYSPLIVRSVVVCDVFYNAAGKPWGYIVLNGDERTPEIQAEADSRPVLFHEDIRKNKPDFEVVRDEAHLEALFFMDSELLAQDQDGNSR